MSNRQVLEELVRAFLNELAEWLKVAAQSLVGGPAPPPVCGVHQVPMKRRQGKFGQFWSCPRKAEDGRWCSYRPSSVR